MSLPSRSEVIGWNSRNLADYLKKMKLVGCDRVVKKSNISGAGFLNMTDEDLRKFPTEHIPNIVNICRHINQKNKEKRSLFQRSDYQVPPNQELNPGGWDPDEFDQGVSGSGSDNEYEQPDNNQFEDNYLCTASCENADSDDDYEPPPREKCSEVPAHFRVAKPLADGDYLDSGPRGSPRPPQDNRAASLPRGLMNISKPPSRPGPPPHRPLVNPNQSKQGPVVPVVDRSKKPGSSKKNTAQSAKNKLPMASKPATLPSQSLQHRFNMQQIGDFTPPLVQVNVMMEQGMDPQWYMGQISRGEAEVSLREVNKDGAFLVRDSSKGCTEQPYTLMVLHQQKVYNIQIRFLGNVDGYSLGTGLNGIENFSTVTEMVLHHMKTPLILIDGLERGAGPQRQCCLIYPAAF